MNQDSSPTCVLFVCVENAGRSQMAEAFARRKGLQAMSAGTVPAESVNPAVVEAMAEKAFNFALKKPKMLTMELVDQADVVITMGCSIEEVCPRPMLAKMQKKLIDWNLEDPKGKSLPVVRRIRNEIERRVEELAQSTREKAQSV
jgi:arsenate reductase (thioredoxin)